MKYIVGNARVGFAGEKVEEGESRVLLGLPHLVRHLPCNFLVVLVFSSASASLRSRRTLAFTVHVSSPLKVLA